jgi:integrase
MKWADLDEHTGVWAKPATGTKQRRVHRVKLTDQAIAVLNKLNTFNRSPYVFPTPEDASKPRSDKLKSFWRQARKQCDLADVRLYDCRHSFASWLAMGGATQLEIACQLGHSNTQTTARYTHLMSEHLREKAELTAAAIAKALAEHDTGYEQMPLLAERKKEGRAIVLQGAEIDASELLKTSK